MELYFWCVECLERLLRDLKIILVLIISHEQIESKSTKCFSRNFNNSYSVIFFKQFQNLFLRSEIFQIKVLLIFRLSIFLLSSTEFFYFFKDCVVLVCDFLDGFWETAVATLRMFDKQPAAASCNSCSSHPTISRSSWNEEKHEAIKSKVSCNLVHML